MHTHSGAVVGVDADVVMAEVGGPDGGAAADPGPRSTRTSNSGWAKIGGGIGFGVVGRRAAVHQLQGPSARRFGPPSRTEAQRAGIDLAMPARPNGGQDAPPVGVAAEERGLDQRAGGDGVGRLVRILRRCGARRRGW